MNDSTDKHQGDPLLECLVFLTGHYGKARSAPSLTAGLPYDEKNMGPNLFCEAADKIGLKSKITHRENIKKLQNAVLPAVLILKGNEACVLLEQSEGEAIIWSPEGQQKSSLSLTDLQSRYDGYCILVHPRADFSGKTNEENQEAGQHWFWGPVLQSKPLYRNVAIASVLINLFALTSPIFIMNVYDRVIPNNALETGWVLGVGALTVFSFDFLMRTLRGYFIDLAGRKADVIAARRIYDQLLNMRLAFRPASSGAFANMLREFDTVRDFYTSATLTAIVDLPFALFFLFIIWLIGGSIALLLFCLIVIVFAIGVMLQAPLKSVVRKATKSSEAKHGLLVETISGLETLKAIGAEGKLRARYGQYIGENAAYGQKSRFISALGVNAATFLQQIASILVVLTGMYLVKDQNLTMGGLIACVMLGSRAIAPIGQVANLMSRYHGAKSALKTLNGIMAQPVERPAEIQFLHRPDLKGQIAFKNVSFSYPNAGRKVLDHVSFSIGPGEKIGVIGRIGSGKSTLARLMVGLYEPEEGTVLYDETDYKQIDPADLRRNTGYISQDVVLFSGTVRDNITASMPHASEEDVLRVSRLSGVHDFISQHPMGYDAPVGERGEGLSGGQRQSIALARAMLLDPSIYICDEPTNAMDVQAETAFTKHLFDQTKGKTLILITHRFQLLPLVERLILMDQGRVVLDGKRDEVLKALSKQGIEVPKDT